AAALAEAHDRSGALHLLAADALLTYAFEAAAERGPEAVTALAERRGAARLALLLAGTTDEESDRERGVQSSAGARPARRGRCPGDGRTDRGGRGAGARGAGGGGPGRWRRWPNAGVTGGLRFSWRGRPMKSPIASEVSSHLRGLGQLAETVAREMAGEIAEVAELVLEALDGGGKLLFCGNGGS